MRTAGIRKTCRTHLDLLARFVAERFWSLGKAMEDIGRSGPLGADEAELYPPTDAT